MPLSSFTVVMKEEPFVDLGEDNSSRNKDD